ALGNDLGRGGRGGHAWLLLAMGAAFFPQDDADMKGGRIAHQFLAPVVADDRPLGSALLAKAVFGVAGNNHFATLQMLRQLLAPGMVGAGSLGLGQWVLLLLRRELGFLLDFRGRDAGLVEEQRRLRRGNRFAFGTPQLEIEQADFLVLQLDDLLQTCDFGGQAGQAVHPGLQTFEGLADWSWQRVERNHLIRIPYTLYQIYCQ